MTYQLSEYGADILSDITAFCEREVAAQAAAADHSHKAPEDMYRAASLMGLTSLAVPEAYDGPGLALEEQAAALEKIAYYDGGLAASCLADNLSAGCVYLFGSEQAKECCSGLLMSGRSGAFCLTEEMTGSDISGLKTSAMKDGSGYRINGSKKFVSNGRTAGYYVVFAETADGTAAFLIPAETEGITPGPEEDKLGFRTCSTCEVAFQDVFVPAELLIGKPGEGRSIAAAALMRGRAFCGAAACGTAQRALDEAVRYSKEREQFGKPLSKNAVIRAKLADMYMKVTAARLSSIHALKMLEQGEDASAEAAAAKCLAAEAASYCADEALQIFGGNGYCEAYPPEKLLRDARAFRIVEGTSEIQRQFIGGKLVK